jgi:hypothetical protein
MALDQKTFEKVQALISKKTMTPLLSANDWDNVKEGFDGYKILNAHEHGHCLLAKKLTDGSDLTDLLIVGEDDDEAVILNPSDYDDALELFDTICRVL